MKAAGWLLSLILIGLMFTQQCRNERILSERDAYLTEAQGRVVSLKGQVSELAGQIDRYEAERRLYKGQYSAKVAQLTKAEKELSNRQGILDNSPPSDLWREFWASSEGVTFAGRLDEYIGLSIEARELTAKADAVADVIEGLHEAKDAAHEKIEAIQGGMIGTAVKAGDELAKIKRPLFRVVFGPGVTYSGGEFHAGLCLTAGVDVGEVWRWIRGRK